jgi:hypothetical protein
MHAVVSDVVVGFANGSTCCVSVFEVDAALFVSPLYVALIACDPADSVDVAHSAVLPLNATDAQIVVAPSLNVTLPVGDCPVTLAVKATLWPAVLGLVALIRLVELAAGSTCCVTVFEVEAALFASPLYSAVIACDPADSVDVAHDALPLLNATVAQIVVAPSLNVTEPVGD